MTFLGLDIGSSELKIAVFDGVGRSLDTVQTSVPHLDIPGRAEMNADAVWQTVVRAIRKLNPGIRREIGAAAISSHGESFVPIDNHGTTTTNFILNIDLRAAHEIAEFVESFGRQRLYEATGLAPHPKYTLPKVAWLRRHEPEIFARSTKFLCMEDYLLFRLQLEPTISRSLASRTMGFGLRESAWNTELLNFAGISEQKLSRAASSGTPVGTMSTRVAGELGLSPKVVWCVGGHDQACASIGAGSLDRNAVTDGTGTFECASTQLEQPLVSSASFAANLSCEGHVIPNRFLTLAAVPGGMVLKWVRDNFAHSGESSYDALLAGLPIEPTGIFSFPYLVGTGTPWLDSRAKGAVYGLNASTTRQSLTQAMLEGVSYEMRWNFEALRRAGVAIEEVLAVGGGARSDAWLQLKSDIFGCAVVRVPGEASARGAAICAAMGVGEYQSWGEAASAMVTRGQVFEPRTEVQLRYDELFQEYKELAHRIYGYRLPAEQDQSS